MVWLACGGVLLLDWFVCCLNCDPGISPGQAFVIWMMGCDWVLVVWCMGVCDRGVSWSGMFWDRGCIDSSVSAM